MPVPAPADEQQDTFVVRTYSPLVRRAQVLAMSLENVQQLLDLEADTAWKAERLQNRRVTGRTA